MLLILEQRSEVKVTVKVVLVAVLTCVSNSIIYVNMFIMNMYIGYVYA